MDASEKSTENGSTAAPAENASPAQQIVAEPSTAEPSVAESAPPDPEHAEIYPLPYLPEAADPVDPEENPPAVQQQQQEVAADTATEEVLPVVGSETNTEESRDGDTAEGDSVIPSPVQVEAAEHTNTVAFTSLVRHEKPKMIAIYDIRDVVSGKCPMTELEQANLFKFFTPLIFLTRPSSSVMTTLFSPAIISDDATSFARHDLMRTQQYVLGIDWSELLPYAKGDAKMVLLVYQRQLCNTSAFTRAFRKAVWQHDRSKKLPIVSGIAANLRLWTIVLSIFFDLRLGAPTVDAIATWCLSLLRHFNSMYRANAHAKHKQKEKLIADDQAVESVLPEKRQYESARDPGNSDKRRRIESQPTESLADDIASPESDVITDAARAVISSGNSCGDNPPPQQQDPVTVEPSLVASENIIPVSDEVPARASMLDLILDGIISLTDAELEIGKKLRLLSGGPITAYNTNYADFFKRNNHNIAVDLSRLHATRDLKTLFARFSMHLRGGTTFTNIFLNTVLWTMRWRLPAVDAVRSADKFWAVVMADYPGADALSGNGIVNWITENLIVPADALLRSAGH